MSTPLLRGFPPVVDERARALILGSFPSAQSLVAGQYYANPRNAFWSITGELFGFEAAVPYGRRLAELQSHGVALWDVLHACRRRGSADAAIDPTTLVVNDFGEFFADYPTISTVYFNGAKAAEFYRRRAVSPDEIQYHRLPSTSPAHAIGRGAKLAAWSVVLTQDTGGRRSAHGRAASICADNDNSVASSNGRPTS